jgi:hypothetical protein
MAHAAVPSTEEASKVHRQFRVEYVTDVEGNLEYFHRFVSLSNVLAYDDAGPPPDSPHAVLTLAASDDHFVFGGDAV